MKKLATFTAVAALLALGGCGEHPDKAQVAQIELALSTAEAAATQYIKAPACPSPSVTICSDPSVVVKIKAADNTAYTLFKQFQAGKATYTDASMALMSLVTLIPVQAK